MAHNLTLFDQFSLSAQSLIDSTTDILNPTLKLGVTGLSRSGKTVFITSLIHQLLYRHRLPGFSAAQSNRINAVYVEPQPNDLIPSFAWQNHIKDLSARDRQWPKSTRQISQLRLVIDYMPTGFIGRHLGAKTLTLDIVDYPGEWLLDLPLMEKSYEQWSLETLELARHPSRMPLSTEWLNHLASLDTSAEWDDQSASICAELFTDYLARGRADNFALSTLPPGRFLMPGDLEGSPALTFCPLPKPETSVTQKSLYAQMQRRYEAYTHKIVRPFYRDHFASLDRQIILIDVLSALNAGRGAVQDLEQALGQILTSFHFGQNHFLQSLFTRKIDRVAIAATKADHIHHTEHDKLENIARRLTQSALGAHVNNQVPISVEAISALRSTREAKVEENGDVLPVLIGTPSNGQKLGEQEFDGITETAIYPGSLPSNPNSALEGGIDAPDFGADDYRFLKFRPPIFNMEDGQPIMPHIRMDRVLEHILGDKLQ